jgi:hypothetical protein
LLQQPIELMILAGVLRRATDFPTRCFGTPVLFPD